MSARHRDDMGSLRLALESGRAVAAIDFPHESALKNRLTLRPAVAVPRDHWPFGNV